MALRVALLARTTYQRNVLPARTGLLRALTTETKPGEQGHKRLLDSVHNS
jgi:hypothetical protein